MRVTSLVLATLGGVFGIILGLVAMLVGGVAEEVEQGSGQEVIWLGVSAIAAAVVAVVASGFHFAGKRTTIMSLVILIAAIWHLVSISYFGILGFLLLAVSSLFAFLSRKHADQKGSAPAYVLSGAAPQTWGSDPKTALRNLTEMRDEGLITVQEYEDKRQGLLEALPSSAGIREKEGSRTGVGAPASPDDLLLDEREQDALQKINNYLKAGHSIEAIREAGWGSWLEALEAKGCVFPRSEL